MGGPTYLDNAELLGKSILLLSNGKNPFDIDKLLEGAREVIKLNDGTKTVGESHGSGFTVPGNIDYASKHTTDHNSLRVETGSELSDTLDGNASLSASYAGVSAEGSAKYSYRGVLSKSKYYAVVSLDHRSFVLTLELPHGKLAVDTGLIDEAKELPEWPNGKNGVHHPSAEDCEEFLDFFRTWGTYVIRSCTFGARYHLKLESHMPKDLSKEEFETHIKAEYDAVASVKGDAGLKTSSKHSSYKRQRKSQVRVRGGDIGKNASLTQSPDDAANFGVNSIGDMVNEAGGMESKERKKLVTNLNTSLSFLNSFQIIQGDLYLYPKLDPASVEIEVQGPPGTEIDYHVIERKTKSHKKSPTHWTFDVPSKKTDDATRVRHIRVCAPPLSVKIVCQTPDHTMVAWHLQCGADVLFTGKETSEEIEVPNLFEEVMYPRYRSG
ncbi:hypothetical protein BJX68DRAFT_266732 [Aspergillus pseudodeflectus]|uniref:MACPF domain-containing protein n=1 Tax=Aspergillus pseudodeflectus TaxID=176178 RepID=A0ABR4KE32_9EURO